MEYRVRDLKKYPELYATAVVRMKNCEHSPSWGNLVLDEKGNPTDETLITYAFSWMVSPEGHLFWSYVSKGEFEKAKEIVMGSFVISPTLFEERRIINNGLWV